LLEGLNILAQQVENGTFTIEEEFEDVHSKNRSFFLQKITEKQEKKIHTARSRKRSSFGCNSTFF
jgi:argininosuccinate lyase